MKSFESVLKEFSATFERNLNIFASYHLHITTKCPDAPVGRHALFGDTLLPIGNNQFVHQHQTSRPVSSIEQMHKVLAEVNIYKPIIGMKIEGVVTHFTPMRSKLVDFLYYEVHEKFPFDDPQPFDPNQYYSWSTRNNKIVTAKRIYDINQPPHVSNFEVCIFDYWWVNIEKNWLDTLASVQFNQLILMGEKLVSSNE